MQNLHIIYEILYSDLQKVFILRTVLEEVDSLLKLKNISKQLDEKIVLKDINLEINSGEIVSLLGQSGSGKTTLLNMHF